MIKNLNAMKKPDPINTVQNNDTFSSGLMEKYGQWMNGDTFQGTEMPNIHEAPFDGMDPQSHGAEIENVAVKKKETKKVNPVGSKETVVKKEEVESKLWNEVSEMLSKLGELTDTKYKVIGEKADAVKEGYKSKKIAKIMAKKK